MKVRKFLPNRLLVNNLSCLCYIVAILFFQTIIINNIHISYMYLYEMLTNIPPLIMSWITKV